MLTIEAHNKIQFRTGFTSIEHGVLFSNEKWKKLYREVLNLYRFNEHNEDLITSKIEEMISLLYLLRVSRSEIINI
jgi:flagellar biosynthesis/type III secretory pathway chaperone